MSKLKFLYVAAATVSVLVWCAFPLVNVQAGNLWEQQQNVMGDGTRSVGAAFGHSGEPADPRSLVVDIIKIFLTFLALIFTIMIILAGYKWMTAGGNQENIKDAQHQIRSAIIGMVIILLAYTITYFVTEGAWEEIDRMSR